ncbi:TlpA family protein disulfide reductase [Nesterenkonia aerolata]|uniref:TlpA disulfide reductase family protein n=1 Tax=Nesterenkonia aerolata TaxID=3074079 RepID=A0ABU2DTE7_9MICC|nr:TlpA disulfide reductase family protein [Nesterenkonia sp. LY-0111]MDR8019671.1 TlpA disulfide reductase family protein [Nesterenkonia sp. LY-0111]
MTSAQAPSAARGRRRTMIGVAGLLAGALALSACGSEENDQLAERASNDGTNYVAGDGSVQEYTEEDRGEPVEFSSTLFDGSTVDPSSWEGEVTVINFWYASCAPCRVEAPDLAEIHQEYQDEGVQFYGVNTRDTQATAEAFERRFGIDYPSMEDRDGEVMLAMTDYVPPSAVPTTLVLDQQGRVSARILGVAEPGTLRTLIDTALEDEATESQAGGHAGGQAESPAASHAVSQAEGQHG